MKITKHPLMLSGPGLASLPADQGVIRKLETSFEMVTGNSEVFAAVFFQRSFSVHPGLRAVLESHLTARRTRLLDSLRRIVVRLRDPRAQLEELAAQGRWHAEYGVRPEHYPPAVSIMVESMAVAAGPGWSADLSAEWTQALLLASDSMIAAARTSVPVTAG